MKELQSKLLANAEAKSKLIEAFKKQQTSEKSDRQSCSVAAKRLVTKALQVLQGHYSKLSEQFKAGKSMELKMGYYTALTEPYFYDSAYKLVKRDYALPTHEYGKCVLAREITADDRTTKCSSKPRPMKWGCTTECKKLSGDEVHAIIELKESFDQPIQEVRQALDVCDNDCPNLHFTKRINKTVVDHESDLSVSSDDGECHSAYETDIGIDRQGHPLVCSNDGGCRSKMHILRAAATHYPLLTKLLHHVCSAVNSRVCKTLTMLCLLVTTIPSLS